MIYLILAIISYVALIVGAIWSVVEFIIFLVKDDPFNWISVILVVVGLVLFMIFGVKAIFEQEPDFVNKFKKEYYDT